jgi:hypothetical protein
MLNAYSVIAQVEERVVLLLIKMMKRRDLLAPADPESALGLRLEFDRVKRCYSFQNLTE